MYLIKSFEKTASSQGEELFNQYYRNHLIPHIDQICQEIPHNFKPGIYKDFVCLVLKWKNGKADKAGWFHKGDLEDADNIYIDGYYLP